MGEKRGSELDKIIRKMIRSGIAREDVIDFVNKDCRNEPLCDKTLGMLYELYVGLSCCDMDEKTQWTAFREG